MDSRKFSWRWFQTILLGRLHNLTWGRIQLIVIFGLVLFQDTKLINSANTEIGDTYEGYYSRSFTLLQLIPLTTEIRSQKADFWRHLQRRKFSPVPSKTVLKCAFSVVGHKSQVTVTSFLSSLKKSLLISLICFGKPIKVCRNVWSMNAQKRWFIEHLRKCQIQTFGSLLYSKLVLWFLSTTSGILAKWFKLLMGTILPVSFQPCCY